MIYSEERIKKSDNFGWLDPEFGGWALSLREVKTEPFSITVQTPVPDPANY